MHCQEIRIHLSAFWSFKISKSFRHLTVMNARSRATRTFVSMLVLFFLRRPGIPSKPREGEDRELGLGRVLSMDMVSEKNGKQNNVLV